MKCKKHPKYKAIHKPHCNCFICWVMWITEGKNKEKNNGNR